MTISPVAFFVFTAPGIVEIPFQIAQNYKVEESVTIQIHPGRAGRPPASPDTSFLGYICEGAITIVAVKFIAAVSRYVEILKTVVIVIANSNAHSIAGSLQASLHGHILKRSVRLLAVKSVPILRISFLRNGPFRSGVSERRSIDDKDVKASIVVIVEQRNSCTHGFQ